MNEIQKFQRMDKDTLVNELVAANNQIKELEEEKGKFEEFVDKIVDFISKLEIVVPNKFLGWFRFILSGFAVVKTIISLVEEFKDTLEDWKNQREIVPTTLKTKTEKMTKSLSKISEKARK